MNALQWVALLISAVGFAYAAGSLYVAIKRSRRDSELQMMNAYLNGYEDALFGQKCDCKRAFRDCGHVIKEDQ